MDGIFLSFEMAEDKRFELLRRLLACTLSKGVHSTTMRILRVRCQLYQKSLNIQVFWEFSESPPHQTGT